ncbi:MAG: proton-conducting membrane transporter [Bacteroidetes bacterium 4572_77]|nr:MAG: proton-conducting membrane transporter [Bacteroidetes bacterium 4572_77]
MNLIQKIYDAGVIGAGGAGFPTHIKYKCNVEYFIINGAECEPLLETDKYLMRTKSIEMIKAIEEVGKELKSKKIIIGLKKEYEKEIDMLNKAIKDLKSSVEIYFLDNFYPAGDEQVLIYEITKKVVPAGGIPLDIGVVVSNVGTMVNVYDALEDKPVVDKYVTVVGEINSPSMLKVPVGTSVFECIEASSGATISDFCVVMGGPMMGKIITKDQIKTSFITKTTGGLIVLPADHYIVKRKNTSIEHIMNQARTSCIQCSMCTDMCPRNLLGHKIRPHRIMRNINMIENNDEVLKEALLCTECGICELYACPMGLSPRTVNAYVKGILKENGIKIKKDKNEPIAKEIREYRKVPITRLTARLNITRYINHGFTKHIEVNSRKVSILLNQHIGKPAYPKVKVGDKVSRGQIIGEVQIGDVGSNIHSSINGKVCEISDKIVIQSEK